MMQCISLNSEMTYLFETTFKSSFEVWGSIAEKLFMYMKYSLLRSNNNLDDGVKRIPVAQMRQ